MNYVSEKFICSLSQTLALLVFLRKALSVKSKKKLGVDDFEL
jgi:hypothetical protein